jgi:broad specificity phosphatase PhoE
MSHAMQRSPAAWSGIAISGRDVDVPLSEQGERQAVALARRFVGSHEDERPQIILSSPYRRARSTAEAVASTCGLEPPCLVIDERLREKEFGMLDGLTARVPQ